MCFLWDGTLERAASATGQLGFIQQAWMDTQRWPPDRTPLHCQPDRRSQVNADLLQLNLILLVIPDQRVFSKSTVTRQQIKKGAWGKMTVNQVVISWRWHQRQADPSERQRRVDMLPRVLPGEVPGSLRRVLCASAPRLRVLVTRTERLSGPNALNHRPPPAHCQGRGSPGSVHILGDATGPPYWFAPSNRHILLCQLIQWCMMLLWHFACFWECSNVNKALHRVNDSS